ncbi:SMI1/KNR4 family protein [Rhizobium laguerreae]|uniref:SMI1/KNR4 family protein n=1 Tax=Rhizobium laguerreae TaxID=1076926 RepID=UPI001038D5DF|nr:SMI1/KNR4 family protein [Rhizobium laguerreae]TBX77830.1 SMI1/KNR4 family protein [Rhizobium laguerreae]
MFDLKAINPGLYENWMLVKDAPPEFHSPPDPSAVQELETLAGGKLPQDYKDFLLEYGDVGGSVQTGVRYFLCRYPDKEVIDSDFAMISGARHTIASTKVLSKPHQTLDNVGPRIPENMIATNIDNYCTFLIDLRSDSFGRMYYISDLKKKTFGTPGYDWDNVAFVGETFTEFMAGVGTKEELKAKYPKVKVR